MDHGEHRDLIGLGHVVHGVGKPAYQRASDVLAGPGKLVWVSTDEGKGRSNRAYELTAEAGRARLVPVERLVELGFRFRLDE
jgi:hypothetical protein